jgi:hypothetical protein
MTYPLLYSSGAAPLRQATELEDCSVAQKEAGDDINSAIGGSYEASASPRARAR